MSGRLIGIAGRKGHGKDTVAGILKADGFEVLRFADPLKAMLRSFYKTLLLDAEAIERRIEGDLKEVPCAFLRGKTPREAMQTLGTEWGRGCMAGDLWVRLLIDRYYIHGSDIVVPDVRFENECRAIQDAGGIVVRVEADARVPQNELSQHSSETHISSIPADVIIKNDGTLADLREAIRVALR